MSTIKIKWKNNLAIAILHLKIQIMNTYQTIKIPIDSYIMYHNKEVNAKAQYLT